MIHDIREDTLIIPLNNDEELVIASDNSGAIGSKPLDEVCVPYEMVAYFTFRVAYMECVAARGIPFSIVLHNFNGDEAWELLRRGIERGINELDIDELPITGSTESNFPMKQSALSMTILGKRSRKQTSDFMINLDDCYISVIGKPLVGYEVIEHKEDVAPLHLYQWFVQQVEVLALFPVGSKGITSELKKAWPKKTFTFNGDLNLEKTSGPATSFIAIYEKSFHERVIDKAGRWYHGRLNALD